MRKHLRTQTIISSELYVQRHADRQLAAVVSDMGRPGYVLVARQMGKTNLLLNAKRSLARTEDCFTYVDLSKSFETERECFRYIVDTIIETIGVASTQVRDTVTKGRELGLPPFREYERELREVMKEVPG